MPKKSTREGLLFLEEKVSQLIPGLTTASRGATHDFYDAMLAAYTAYLHHLGRTEAVGDPEEGTIIIPDRAHSPVEVRVNIRPTVIARAQVNDQDDRPTGPTGKPLCICGCGSEVIRPTARFYPSHDSKLKSLLIKVVKKGEYGYDRIPEIARPFLEELSSRWRGIPFKAPFDQG